MENPLARLCDNVRSLSNGRIFFVIFERPDVQELIAELQRRQLGRGDTAEGGQFRDYAENSIEFYDKPTSTNPYFDSSGGDAIRFYDEGDVYESADVVKVTEDEATIFMQTEFEGEDGAVDLEEISRVIVGLNEDSLEELREFIIPLIIEQVHGAIFEGVEP